MRSEFGKVVDARMKLLGLRRSEVLAQMADQGHGVTRQAMSKWMTGKSRPTYEDLVALASVLRIPVEERGRLLDLLASSESAA